MDKVEELKFASHFIKKLNKKYSKDYLVSSNENEDIIDGDVDVYGISAADRSNKLNIQCVSRNGRYREMIAKQRKKIEKNLPLSDGDVILQVGIIAQVKELIDAKENAYSRPQDLILIVMNDFSYTLSESDFPHVDKIFGDYKNYKLKGIYFINTPDHNDGQIIVLKNIYNDRVVVL